MGSQVTPPTIVLTPRVTTVRGALNTITNASFSPAYQTMSFQLGPVGWKAEFIPDPNREDRSRWLDRLAITARMNVTRITLDANRTRVLSEPPPHGARTNSLAIDQRGKMITHYLTSRATLVLENIP